MVRISPEVLASAEQRINPLQERELVLSGLGIAAIENMGALTDNAFDCYDLSHNRISSLENFASAPRVTTLLCHHNHIHALSVKNLTKNLPNVTTLSLHANAITSLAHIKIIAQAFPKLVFLDLTGNPVTRRQYYRLYTIQHIPTLRSLDFGKVTRTERATAKRLAESAAGAALEDDIAKNRLDNNAFEVAEGDDDDDAALANAFTVEQKEQIRELLANATSIQQVEEIENSVKRGLLPAQLQQDQPTAKRQKVDD